MLGDGVVEGRGVGGGDAWVVGRSLHFCFLFLFCIFPFVIGIDGGDVVVVVARAVGGCK